MGTRSVTYDPKIGDILYPSFLPGRAFKVTSVVKSQSEFNPKISVYDVVGVNKKGETVTYRDFSFNSFTALVEQTEKKAKNHRSLHDTLKAL